MLPKAKHYSAQGTSARVSAYGVLILRTQNRFIELARTTKLPPRRDVAYQESLRTLHSAILGICALIESFPYSVETWMPPLTDSASSLGLILNCRG